MPERLRCATETDGDVITLHPAGPLARDSVAALRSFLDKAFAAGPAAIIVNLSNVTVEDESCLTPIPTVAESQTAVLLSAATDMVAQWFRALGLDQHIVHYPGPSTGSADGQLAGPRQRRRIGPTVEAPATARAFVDDTCSRWLVSAAVIETLKLIVTELVTNAVRHARPPIELVIRRSRWHIHLAVIDEERQLAILRGPETPRSSTGRGLMLVEAFATAWGCTPTPSGKSTWATVRYAG
jgi:anti-anti-sigma regulatory factor